MNGFSLGHWLVVGFLAWLVYRFWVSHRPAGKVTPDSEHGAGLSVVGESFYRHNFERLFKPDASGRDREARATATLKLDDRNLHDDKAVAVFIDGLQVGHLSREDARRFRKSKGADRRDTLVSATVWVPGEPDYHYSVSLTLRL